MKFSNNYYGRIVLFEGFRNTAYLCPAGRWTIGYGTTKNVKQGDKVTMSQAYELMRSDSDELAKQVSSLQMELTQNQFDAIGCFCYNLGFYKFKCSTLYKFIKANPNDKRIWTEWQRWVYSCGKKLDGLVKRRRNEVELYFHGSGVNIDELQND